MAGGFESLGLLDELVMGVQAMGWTLPTDVQVRPTCSLHGLMPHVHHHITLDSIYCIR